MQYLERISAQIVFLRTAPAIQLEEQIEVLQFPQTFCQASPGSLPVVHTAFFLCIYSDKGVLWDSHIFSYAYMVCAGSFQFLQHLIRLKGPKESTVSHKIYSLCIHFALLHCRLSQSKIFLLSIQLTNQGDHDTYYYEIKKNY